MLPRGEISLVVKVRVTVKEQLLLHAQVFRKILVPSVDTTDRGWLACVSTGRYDLNRGELCFCSGKQVSGRSGQKQTKTYYCSDNYIILI